MRVKVIGLRTATTKEIADLSKQYPQGTHKTHKADGTELPFNGIFITGNSK